MVAVETLDYTPDRLVIVNARELDDLLELVRLASDRLGDDSLTDALDGARAAVAQTVTREPDAL